MADKNIERIDKSNNIYIETGTELNLAINGLSLPMKCTFVGKKSDHSLVITPPSNFAAFENHLLQSQHIKIKFLFKGTVLQFTTKLIEITSKPLTLLILEYPTSIEKKESRSQKRISCYISAKIEINNETKVGVIKDISKQGCRCVFDVVNKKENIFQIDDQITLSFYFPGFADEQEILGKIKDIRIKEKQLEFGIEFASIAWWVPPYD